MLLTFVCSSGPRSKVANSNTEVLKEFVIQLETRIQNIIGTKNIEKNDESAKGEKLSKPKGRPKKAKEEGIVDQPTEDNKSKRKAPKIDPGLVSFLNQYHKKLWVAKYNAKFVRETTEDEIDICDEVLKLCLVHFYYSCIFILVI